MIKKLLSVFSVLYTNYYLAHQLLLHTYPAGPARLPAPSRGERATQGEGIRRGALWGHQAMPPRQTPSSAGENRLHSASDRKGRAGVARQPPRTARQNLGDCSGGGKCVRLHLFPFVVLTPLLTFMCGRRVAQ